ncbi:baseplate multidomain protein megatron [Futiania mangrovi]|uniref:Glycoside hydrolase TIM-barrel-like domain-containing protein n=1 Tax=Futiania mangrovi TaxID=2959716 RepID=A0A9J6PKZ6_9PROT|nr:glycoside hydrolase TIM-barrel-like domain-containing protein [Futiania mangrovii]MCP1337271.1 glycoside hydrolase TIM-barrel-like domain-containing protein [Futiania mangrovii]
MATLLLTAAGSAAGGALLPGLGIGGYALTGAQIGAAVGGLAGTLIDSALFAPAPVRREGPRLTDLHIQGGAEGAAIPAVFGRARIAGQVIWAARFRETATTRSAGGGKGLGGGASSTVTEYEYSASFAIGLCEGPIARVGRIWADGRPLDLTGLAIRVHKGAGDQLPDPLIEMVEGAGNAPAYRDLAYVVFEDLPLGPFGNRVPQLSFEVVRPVPAADGGPSFEERIEAIALIPGAGEFALATDGVVKTDGAGTSAGENLNTATGQPDLLASLDALDAAAPNLGSVSLVVSWFGTDLRCGRCEVRPGVEVASKTTAPLTWRAGGVGRAEAHLVSRIDGQPAYGGTPSDDSVLQAIAELKARGHGVVFNPFLMMDVPAGNALPDPWTGAPFQPAYPWRGRIVCDPAPGGANLLADPDLAGPAWGLVDGAQVTPRAAPDPAGGEAAALLADPGNGWAQAGQTLTVPAAETTYMLSAFIAKQPGAAAFPVLRANMLGGRRADIALNPATGAFATKTFSGAVILEAGVEDHGTHWRPWMRFRNPSSSTVRVEIYPAVGLVSAFPNYSGGATGTVGIWRVELREAPERPVDNTPLAAAQVAAFFGTASPAQFSVSGSTVTYSGPPEWSYRRFVLHYAHLCAAAGGVDAFLLGSELRALTQVRSGPGVYPAVDALRALASDVRAILGPSVKIGYAADWSEYFGHQPADGTGDVFFHLDPLWADGNVDFVGIDAYFPLADWRDGEGHADALAGFRPYDPAYFAANVAGGEGFDWYYPDEAARIAQTRVPITDGAYGEPWVFRPKHLAAWWTNAHRDRVSGIRKAQATGWVPQSRPIWLMELGVPAVDKGANQPNLFLDPKSSESALPAFSDGAKDEFVQRRALDAVLGYWQPEAGNNPVSTVYGGPMVDPARIHLWAWDARPFPDFPARLSVWRDGENWRRGHWLTGRLGLVPLADLIAVLCARAGVTNVDVTRVEGLVAGYALDRVMSPRAALEALLATWRVDVVERGATLVFATRGGAVPRDMDLAGLALASEDEAPRLPALRQTRADPGPLPASVKLSFVDALGDYARSAVEARRAATLTRGVEVADAAVVLAADDAVALAEAALAEAWSARTVWRFALPPAFLDVEAGDVLRLALPEGPRLVRVTRTGWTDRVEVEAVAHDGAVRVRADGDAGTPNLASPALRGPVDLAFLDLPLLDGEDAAHQPWAAAFAEPWPGGVALWRVGEGGALALDLRLDRPALMGRTDTDFYAGPVGVWDRGNQLWVQFPQGGELLARPDGAVLSGANLAAVEGPDGRWEVLQFAAAELVAPGKYRLSRFLRAQGGTEDAMANPVPAGARFVVLDGALRQVPLSLDQRGLPISWRYGPSGRAPDHAFYREETRTFAAFGLRPLSPVHLRARRDPATGDIAFGWIRRTRLGGDSWEGEVPLAEEREVYRLEILSGATPVRIVETATPTWSYPAAAQTADFGAPVGGALTVRVAQVSALFGPGLGRTATLYL